MVKTSQIIDWKINHKEGVRLEIMSSFVMLHLTCCFRGKSYFFPKFSLTLWFDWDNVETITKLPFHKHATQVDAPRDSVPHRIHNCTCKLYSSHFLKRRMSKISCIKSENGILFKNLTFLKFRIWGTNLWKSCDKWQFIWQIPLKRFLFTYLKL